MSDFAKLFEESFSGDQLRAGDIIKATVNFVNKNYVIVSAGLKTDSVIDASEFTDETGAITVSTGDEINVVVEAIEDGFGETRLSYAKAKRAAAWTYLEKAYESDEPVEGVVETRVKGGFTVDIDSVKAFLPGSLVDVRPVRDPGSLEGRKLEFKLIKMDRKRSNIVVSRRAIIEQTSSEGAVLLENLNEGDDIKGVVKNITDYGAFVDLGGVDGLLHITDMSWKRVKHPSEIMKVGDELDVKVLKIDRDKRRVSLGMKQMGEDPWMNVARRYPVGTRLFGKVSNITDYGCFVEIEEGIEGLVHMSEMDWTNKNIHPSKVVSAGDEVEVIVLEIDEDRRRISLGIKQCQANPWEAFSGAHKEGEKISGPIKSITDFGIFIGLDGGIDGLVHLSDISWTESGETAVHKYEKGQELEALILSVDSERERISLGLKQLEEDPLAKFLEAHPKGENITGKVTEVDAKRAVLDLGDNIHGLLRAPEFSNEAINDLSEHVKVGDEISPYILGVDRNKQHYIALSMKSSGGGSKSYSTETDTASPTLGDIMKQQMEGKDD